MSLVLLLARHGETADNASSRFQGQGGRGLNLLGRLQAARLAARLRRAPPLAIVTSDLERAVETAQIVSDACGVPIEIDPGLREVDVGSWTGKTFAEIAREFPEEWAAWEQGLDVRRGGGETYAELALRVDAAIGRVAERHGRHEPIAPSRSSSQKTRETSSQTTHETPSRRGVLVVSHGGAIKSWVATILGVRSAGAGLLGGLTNTSLSVVERLHAGRHRVHVWNDSAHLDDLVERG